MTLSLPEDIATMVVSYLDTPYEIVKAAAISKAFRNAATNEKLWREMACRRYGLPLAFGTRNLYKSYRDMVLDDNRLGALPTLDGHSWWWSDWIPDESGHSGLLTHRCNISCIKWDRTSNQLLLFLEALGTGFLPPPQTSAVWRQGNWNTDEGHFKDYDEYYERWHLDENAVQHEFESLYTNKPTRLRCYKGILKVDANLFTQSGSYAFAYGTNLLGTDMYFYYGREEYNRCDSLKHNYYSKPCTLFALNRPNGLIDAFDCYSSRDVTTLISDPPQSREDFFRLLCWNNFR